MAHSSSSQAPSVSYHSPRVVLKIPDISAGLNNTTVSVSDSEPCCSPVGIVYKDISKTLTPRAQVFERSVKIVPPSETVMRKVDLTSAERRCSKKDTFEEQETEENNEGCDEPKDCIQNNADFQNSGQGHELSQSQLDRDSSTKDSQENSPMPKSSDYTEAEQRNESTDESDIHQKTAPKKLAAESVLRNSPITFYSAPNYGAIPPTQNFEQSESSYQEPIISKSYTEPNISGWPLNGEQSTGQFSPPLETPPLPANVDGNIFNFALPAKVENHSPYLASSGLASSGYRSSDLLSPVGGGALSIQPMQSPSSSFSPPVTHPDLPRKTKVVYVPVPVAVSSTPYAGCKVDPSLQMGLQSLLPSQFPTEKGTRFDPFCNSYRRAGCTSSPFAFASQDCFGSFKTRKPQLDFSDISSSEDEYDGYKCTSNKTESGFSRTKRDPYVSRQTRGYPKKRRKKKELKRRSSKRPVRDINQNTVIPSSLYGHPNVPSTKAGQVPPLQQYTTLSGSNSAAKTPPGFGTVPGDFLTRSSPLGSSFQKDGSSSGRTTPNTVHYLPSPMVNSGDTRNVAVGQTLNQNHFQSSYVQRVKCSTPVTMSTLSSVQNINPGPGSSYGSLSPLQGAMSPNVNPFTATSYMNSNQLFAFQQVNNTFALTPAVVEPQVQGIQLRLIPCGNGQFVLSTSPPNVSGVSALQTSMLPLFSQSPPQSSLLLSQTNGFQAVPVDSTSPLTRSRRVGQAESTSRAPAASLKPISVDVSGQAMLAQQLPGSPLPGDSQKANCTGSTHSSGIPWVKDERKNFKREQLSLKEMEHDTSVFCLAENMMHIKPAVSQPSEVKGNAAPKPRQIFDIKMVKIGRFRYSLSFDNEDRNKYAKVKIFVAKELLVYELELIRCPEDYDLLKCPCSVIELPFDIICGLGFVDNYNILIEVKRAPAMYLGYRLCDSNGDLLPNKQGCYNRGRVTDLTSGELFTKAFHEITLRKPESLKLLLELAKSYSNFMSLLQQPVAFDQQKTIGPPDHELYDSPMLMKCYKVYLEEVQESDCKMPCGAKLNHTCLCSQGCQFSRCGCIQRFAKCNSDCKCTKTLKNCNNPANRLEGMGYNLTQCYKDACFMAKMFSAKNIGDILATPVILPCCGKMAALSQLSPGPVSCPGCSQHTYKYSWCLGKLCDEEVVPRRHCSLCDRCADDMVFHCKIARRCHLLGFPNCTCYDMARTNARRASKSVLHLSAETTSPGRSLSATPRRSSVVKEEEENSESRSVPILQPMKNRSEASISKVENRFSGLTEQATEGVIKSQAVPSSLGEADHCVVISPVAAQSHVLNEKLLIATARDVEVSNQEIGNVITSKADEDVNKCSNMAKKEKIPTISVTSQRGTISILNTEISQQMEKLPTYDNFDSTPSSDSKADGNIKPRHQRYPKEELVSQGNRIKKLNARSTTCCRLTHRARKAPTPGCAAADILLTNNRDPMCGGQIDELSCSGEDNCATAAEQYYEITNGPDSVGVSVDQHLDLLPDLPHFAEVAHLDLGKPLHESSPMQKTATQR